MKRKVLIADDEPNIVTALEFLLKRSGYDVRTVARTARRRSRASRPTGRTWCCSTS